jgi:hypothetical protein
MQTPRLVRRARLRDRRQLILAEEVHRAEHNLADLVPAHEPDHRPAGRVLDDRRRAALLNAREPPRSTLTTSSSW